VKIVIFLDTRNVSSLVWSKNCSVSAEYLALLEYEEFVICVDCHSSVVSSLCLCLKGTNFGLGMEASYL
jgi:hypothetical protein